MAAGCLSSCFPPWGSHQVSRPASSSLSPPAREPARTKTSCGWAQHYTAQFYTIGASETHRAPTVSIHVGK